MIGLTLELYREVGYYDKINNILFTNVTEESNYCDIIKNVTEDILSQYDLIESMEEKECADYRRVVFKDDTKIIYDGVIVWVYK